MDIISDPRVCSRSVRAKRGTTSYARSSSGVLFEPAVAGESRRLWGSWGQSPRELMGNRRVEGPPGPYKHEVTICDLKGRIWICLRPIN